jgi:hypothetical protein
MVLFENRDYFINFDKINNEKTNEENNGQDFPNKSFNSNKLKKKIQTIFKLRIILTFLYGFLVSEAVVIILMIFVFYSFENITQLGIFEKYSILAILVVSAMIYIWSFLSIWLTKSISITFLVILVNLINLILVFLTNVYFINKIINLYAYQIKLNAENETILISIMKSYYSLIEISFLIFILIDFVSFGFLCLFYKKYNERNRKNLI